MKEISRRQLKISLELRKVAQDFFQRESSNVALITVTDADVSADIKNCTLRITVLPEKAEVSALNFARKMRAQLRTEIKKKMNIRNIPFVEIEIDRGERHRQKIEELIIKENLSRPFKDEKGEPEISISRSGSLEKEQLIEEIIRVKGDTKEDKLESEMD